MRNKNPKPGARKNSYKQQILKDLFLKEEIKGEERSTFFILFIIIPVLALCTIIVGVVENFHFNSVFNFIVCIGIALYYTTILVILKKKIYKPFMKYISVTMNVMFLTFLLTGYSIESGWVHTLRTVVITGYILCIISAGLYQNPVVPIYAGVMSSISYGCLTIFGLVVAKTPFGIVETFFAPTFSFDIIAFYFTVFLITAAIVSSLNSRYRRMLERSLESEAYNRVTKRANAQKTRFFINLAHETKTPLTLISNYIDEYAKKHGEERELGIIRANLEKLKQDMIGFLDFEKLAQGKIVYNHDKIVHVSKILSMQALLFGELALKKGIELTSTIADKIHIRIDPSALERIINNIIENAVKYTEPGGRIDVTLEAHGPVICFSVVNTGSGIPDKQREKIFKPFYQLSHAKKNTQGIGMGLAIVKKIVEEINGRIRIESEPGKTTRFTVDFPGITPGQEDLIIDEYKFSASPLALENVTLLPETQESGKPNLFIVEDNRAMLRYLQDKLGCEFNVYYAFNGNDALGKIGKVPEPDVIISDIMMDGMDGYEFRDNLMQIEAYHSVPFVYVTALTSEHEKMKGLKKGAIEYLYKPFRIDELVEKIRSIIKVRDALARKNLLALSRTLYYRLERTETNRVQIPEEDATSSPRKRKSLFQKHGITKRQVEVIALLRAGFERKEIADRLNISINTVNTQMSRMFERFAVNNKTELLNIIAG